MSDVPKGLLAKGREESFYCRKPDHLKNDCKKKMKWDLEKEKKQKQASGYSKDYERTFPFLLTNMLGEIEITIKGEITKALVDTEATLSVLNPT